MTIPLRAILGFVLVTTSPALAAGASATRLVPIVLDVSGVGTSRYTTELTLANRGTTAATVLMTYAPATSLGATGGGTASVSLAPGRQQVIPDTIAWLRMQGLSIPTGSNQGGTLLVAFSGLSSPDAAFANARTMTPSGAGRAGLSYPGVDLNAAATGSTYLYGLRNTTGDRTNLALANAGSASVTLRVTLYSGTAGDNRTYVLSPNTVLASGQWTQVSRVLDASGLANAYAKVEVVSGTGPYVAYAVFNDNTTNDGSYVGAEPSTMPNEPRLLPVLVESTSYQSELVLTNPLTVAQTATLTYVESASPAGGAGGSTTVDMAAGEQKIIPGAIDFLRRNKVAIGAKGSATFAGALSVSFTNGTNASSGFVGARTASLFNGGGPGEYGLFYPGVGRSFAATFEAWVYGLEQNFANRSNLAVVNLGDAGDTIAIRVDVYDGSSGKLAGSTGTTTLAPGAWSQLNAVLSSFNVSSGYAHVVKLSGRSRFLAYGVVNDGGAPGQGTSDGSYVAAVAVAPITSFSVGPDIAVSYPAGMPYLTDEMMTFVPLGTGSSSYRVFAAGMDDALGRNGPAVLETSDLNNFAFAAGYTSPPLTSANPFATCKATYDPQFDLNYAAPGAVWQDPTRAPGNLIMIYEAENHCPGAVDTFAYYVTVGRARSSDGGKTWPKPIDTELGGANRYVALKGPVPEPSTPENPPVPLGCAIPNAFIDGDEIYVTYNHEGPDFDGVLRVARATLGTSEPLAFAKWYEGAFSQPGIGGLDTGVFPAKGCVGYQDQAQISRYDPLGIYVMTFSCLTPWLNEAAWYYSTATSLDRQNWTAPRIIEGSSNPLTTPCSAGNDGGLWDGWYPSFVSPGTAEGHLSTTGSVFFSNGCQTGARKFTSRAFTIVSPPPVN